MTLLHKISALALLLLASACGTDIPRDAAPADTHAAIYPDYAGVTIPSNIAPLNFEILDDADAYVTHLYTRSNPDGIRAAGKVIDIDVKRWHSLLDTAREGDSLFVDIYCRQQGTWHRHPTIANPVASAIDPYIAYRLIEPSYIVFESMQICQRDLRNFDETGIYYNMPRSSETTGQCINCHSFQAHNTTGRFQMHLRQNEGGTIIAFNDTVMKLNLKTDSTISAGVYPAWHPTLPLIAYSVNTTGQKFHTRHPNKIEVQDSESALILCDPLAATVTPISSADDGVLETFPAWSPDGRWLYYTACRLPDGVRGDSLVNEYMTTHYRDLKYDLMRRPFDPATRAFGPVDTVFMASAEGRSATLPRVSPDGRLLMFTMGEYGTFHIWHRDADLYTLNLQDNTVTPLHGANSPDVESYHSWSSTGRWTIFSSRRDDGSYTRLYIAHIDDDGRASKPFLLPQRRPSHNIERMKSYNIPEFMVNPIRQSRAQLLQASKCPALQATLKD